MPGMAEFTAGDRPPTSFAKSIVVDRRRKLGAATTWRERRAEIKQEPRDQKRDQTASTTDESATNFTAGTETQTGSISVLIKSCRKRNTIRTAWLRSEIV